MCFIAERVYRKMIKSREDYRKYYKEEIRATGLEEGLKYSRAIGKGELIEL